MICPKLCGQYKNTTAIENIKIKQRTDVAFREVSVLFFAPISLSYIQIFL